MTPSGPCIISTPSGARAFPGGLFTRASAELLGSLVARELKARYKGSVFGFLWALLVPLFMAFIYVVFLRLLVGRGVSVESVIVGVFAWQYTVQCVQGGMVSITANANLVKKVFFPRVLLPVAVTAANLVNFLLSLVVQYAVLLVLAAMGGPGLGGAWWALPAAIAWLTVFNLAMALLLAGANVHFRDTQHLVGVLMSAWFFVSPVMYDLSFLEPFAAQRPWLMPLVWLNPMTGLLTAARACVLPGVEFPWTVWSVAGLAIPGILLAAGVIAFRRARRHFADVL
ncbi:MAG: ABC transporter permease [Verrucomicrobia bacterium]|nr:ABC transporter permease [Verrucomicrobiota bacterium]